MKAVQSEMARSLFKDETVGRQILSAIYEARNNNTELLTTIDINNITYKISSIK